MSSRKERLAGSRQPNQCMHQGRTTTRFKQVEAITKVGEDVPFMLREGLVAAMNKYD
jgi:hypothetical protein